MVVFSLPFPELGRVAFARFTILDIGYSFVVLNFVQDYGGVFFFLVFLLLLLCVF
jgi:hypothetical protein